ncbi:MAG: putative glutamine amidotransferase [Thermoleophilaceae bacterium]|jgi:putative glutamine amidotransferase|nr:putative glutamine amidotransferase [Thermoleophilaceae bacterium]
MGARMTDQPLIGLTTSEVRGEKEFKPTPQGDPARKDLALGFKYFEAIERAGGIPVILPPVGPQAIDPLLSRLSGICIAGGPDIDPRTYGGEGHPQLGPTEPELDKFELAVTWAARARCIPILAICRGAQMLNVALGGSLHMHLPDDAGEKVEHRRAGSDGPAASHQIRVERDSMLGRVIDADRVTVNSYHHQAARKLGRGLRAVAHADDGVIEAIELNGPDFVVGVQWHAECMDVPEQRALFESFVVAASRSAGATAEERLAA